MNSFTLKITQNINYEQAISNYILQKNQTISQGIDYIIKELQNSRNAILNFPKYINNLEKLDEMRQKYTIYINMLYIVKKNILFGNEDYTVNLNFNWTDILTEKEFSSNNIDFEYYNSLFNLASIYYLIGINYKNSNNDQISIYFKNALSIFKIIKNECYKKLNKNELCFDLYPSYLEYCCNLCIIQGQLFLVKLLKNNFEIESRMYLNISNMFRKSFKLFHQFPLNRYLDIKSQNYLSINSIFYEGITCLKLRENIENIYKEEIIGKYGDALFYQFLSIEKFTEYKNNIIKLNIDDENNINKIINEQIEYGNQMFENNKKYKSVIPKNIDINKITDKNYINEILPTNLFINVNFTLQNNQINQINSELEKFIPNEIKILIFEYKNKMEEYIKSKLNIFPNQTQIMSYINSLQLPNKYTIKDIEDLPKEVNVNINEEIKMKILQIQQIGNTKILNEFINDIKNKSNDLFNKLNNLMGLLKKEYDEDLQMRKIFQKEYNVIEKSNNVNKKYINEIMGYLNQLNNIKKFDIQQENEIIQYLNNFEILNQPFELINKNIPGRIVEGKDNMTQQDINIRESILEIYILSDKLNDIINNIYEYLNDDNTLLYLFSEIYFHQKENNICDNFKKDIDDKISEIEFLVKIINEKKNILEYNINLLKNDININNKIQEGINYIRSLESISNIFLNKYESLRNGLNFYFQLEAKINELIIATNKFIEERDNNKRSFVSYKTSKTYEEYMREINFNYNNNDMEKNPYKYFNVSQNLMINPSYGNNQISPNSFQNQQINFEKNNNNQFNIKK